MDIVARNLTKDTERTTRTPQALAATESATSSELPACRYATMGLARMSYRAYTVRTRWSETASDQQLIRVQDIEDEE